MSGLFKNHVSVNKVHNEINSYPYQRRGAKVYGPDRIGIVGFHDYGFVIAKPAEAFASWLQERCQNVHKNMGGSSTNLTDGLRKAVEVLKNTPPGIIRRVWLLTDGYPNRETSSIMSVVDETRRAYINVNTIGFGDQYDEGLLRKISQSTHNGKFVPVKTLRQLIETFVSGSDMINCQNQHHQRSETTILAIDLSPSMNMKMEGRKKISVVEEAILQLIYYKQKCFS